MGNIGQVYLMVNINGFHNGFQLVMVWIPKNAFFTMENPNLEMDDNLG